MRWVAAVSAIALATIAVRLAWSGAPAAPTAVAFAGAAGSFAIVVALLAPKRQRSGFAAGVGLGLARSARLVIAGLVFLATVVPVGMYVTGQSFLLASSAVLIDAATAAGQPAGVLVALVFALQFLLAMDGRWLVRGAPAEESAAGQRLGWALGFAPVLIGIAAGLSAAQRA